MQVFLKNSMFIQELIKICGKFNSKKSFMQGFLKKLYFYKNFPEHFPFSIFSCKSSGSCAERRFLKKKKLLRDFFVYISKLADDISHH